MDYTICKYVIKKAREDYKIIANLLMPFTGENSNRVVKNSRILDSYSEYPSELIRSWVTLMTALNQWKNIENEEENIFIKSCRKTHDKRLIVNEKEDYFVSDYEGLNVFSALEAIEEIAQVKTQIIQKGKGNFISTGDNSPNTKRKK